MKNLKSHFKFNKQERNGIFFLLLFIFIFQGVYLYLKAQSFERESRFVLNEVAQDKLDSLKANLATDTREVFPFNPNYMTDYKGYTLGMSTEEVDRLLAYRNKNKYVNSAEDFQRVTKISDSLLVRIKPYLKFTKWKKRYNTESTRTSGKTTGPSITKKDINVATAEELRVVNGVGEVLSKRIVKFRNRLGGFVNNDQLKDVYGLEPEVVERMLEKFDVISIPSINKINLNKASADQLSKLVYINRTLAQQIVAFRAANGPFDSLDDLTQVEGFPQERIDRIKLYLQL